MLQTHVVAVAIFVAKVKEVAADQCPHSAFIQINGANDVGLTVGGVKVLSIGGDPRRLCETRLEQGPIEPGLAARTGKSRDLVLIQIEFPNLMRTSHGDVQ